MITLGLNTLLQMKGGTTFFANLWIRTTGSAPVKVKNVIDERCESTP